MRAIGCGLFLGLLLFISSFVFWSQLPNHRFFLDYEKNADMIRAAVESGQTNQILFTLSGLVGAFILGAILGLHTPRDEPAVVGMGIIFFVSIGIGIIIGVVIGDGSIIVTIGAVIGIVFGGAGFGSGVLEDITEKWSSEDRRQATLTALGTPAVLFLLTITLFRSALPQLPTPLPPMEATIQALQGGINQQARLLTQTPIQQTAEARQLQASQTAEAYQTGTAAVYESTLASLNQTQTALAAVAQGSGVPPTPTATLTFIPSPVVSLTPTPSPTLPDVPTLIAMQNELAVLQAQASLTPPENSEKSSINEGNSLGFSDKLAIIALVVTVIGTIIAALALARDYFGWQKK